MGDRVIDPNDAVDFMLKHAADYAQAKANRIHMDEFRKSKKALLMKSSGVEAIGAQEREAYAHPEYVSHLDGMRAAVEVEETLRWKLEAARLRVEIWRTQEASNRAQERATR